MTAAVSDLYNRADNPLSLGTPTVGPPWLAPAAGVWGTFGNRGYCASSVAAYAAVAVETGMADCIVEVTVSTMPANTFAGLWLRAGATIASGFMMQADSLWDNNASTQIGSNFSSNFVTGDRMRAVLNGTSITILRQVAALGLWTQVLATTSSLYLTNTRHGKNVFNAATDARFDNFSVSPLAGMPDVKVEIAFNAGYFTPVASRTWTDVSTYVELEAGIDISHGRADEFANAEANRLTLTLDNSDGRFTAGKVAGAYYPNVKIGRPIRVTSTLNAVDYVRFVGYIDEWPVSWVGSTNYAMAQITASSRIARLGFDAELQATIAEEFLASDPFAYYQINEPEGATSVADSVVGGTPLLVRGEGTPIAFGAQTELASTPPGATFVGNGLGQYLYNSALAGTLTNASPDVVMIECFAENVNSTGGAQTMVTIAGPGSNDDDFSIFISGSQIKATAEDAFNDEEVATAFVPIDIDTEPHHLAATLARSGGGTTTINLYVDGVLVATNSSALLDALVFTKLYVGLGIGLISHVLINGDPASVADRAAAGLTGFAGETAGDRIERYGLYGGIDPTEVSADPGNPVGTIETAGSGVLDAMRKVEATEDGVLFDGRDNTLVFHDRDRRYNTTSTFTVDAATQQIEADVAPKLDRSTLANDVTASTSDDQSTARAINQTSIDEYGYARVSIEIAGNQDAGYQAAVWRVALYGQPLPRILALSVDLLPLSTVMQANILNAEVSTRITVAGLPTQAPATSIDFFIEGYAESIDPESYRFSFNISPTNDTLRTFWILQDATYGVYENFPLAY